MQQNEVFEKLATIESLPIAIDELLTTTTSQACALTIEGIKKLRDKNIRDEKEATYWWMNDNYEHIAAVLRAAVLLAAEAAELSADVWSALRAKDKQEAMQ